VHKCIDNQSHGSHTRRPVHTLNRNWTELNWLWTATNSFLVSGPRRLCKISSKSKKNCDRIEATTGRHADRRQWFYESRTSAPLPPAQGPQCSNHPGHSPFHLLVQTVYAVIVGLIRINVNTYNTGWLSSCNVFFHDLYYSSNRAMPLTK